eukprot:g9590.t1
MNNSGLGAEEVVDYPFLDDTPPHDIRDHGEGDRPRILDEKEVREAERELEFPLADLMAGLTLQGTSEQSSAAAGAGRGSSPTGTTASPGAAGGGNANAPAKSSGKLQPSKFNSPPPAQLPLLTDEQLLNQCIRDNRRERWEQVRQRACASARASAKSGLDCLRKASASTTQAGLGCLKKAALSTAHLAAFLFVPGTLSTTCLSAAEETEMRGLQKEVKKLQSSLRGALRGEHDGPNRGSCSAAVAMIDRLDALTEKQQRARKRRLRRRAGILGVLTAAYYTALWWHVGTNCELADCGALTNGQCYLIDYGVKDQWRDYCGLQVPNHLGDVEVGRAFLAVPDVAKRIDSGAGGGGAGGRVGDVDERKGLLREKSKFYLITHRPDQSAVVDSPPPPGASVSSREDHDKEALGTASAEEVVDDLAAQLSSLLSLKEEKPPRRSPGNVTSWVNATEFIHEITDSQCAPAHSIQVLQEYVRSFQDACYENEFGLFAFGPVDGNTSQPLISQDSFLLSSFPMLHDLLFGTKQASGIAPKNGHLYFTVPMPSGEGSSETLSVHLPWDREQTWAEHIRKPLLDHFFEQRGRISASTTGGAGVEVDGDGVADEDALMTLISVASTSNAKSLPKNKTKSCSRSSSDSGQPAAGEVEVDEASEETARVRGLRDQFLGVAVPARQKCTLNRRLPILSCGALRPEQLSLARKVMAAMHSFEGIWDVHSGEGINHDDEPRSRTTRNPESWFSAAFASVQNTFGSMRLALPDELLKISTTSEEERKIKKPRDHEEVRLSASAPHPTNAFVSHVNRIIRSTFHTPTRGAFAVYVAEDALDLVEISGVDGSESEVDAVNEKLKGEHLQAVKIIAHFPQFEQKENAQEQRDWQAKNVEKMVTILSDVKRRRILVVRSEHLIAEILQTTQREHALQQEALLSHAALAGEGVVGVAPQQVEAPGSSASAAGAGVGDGEEEKKAPPPGYWRTSFLGNRPRIIHVANDAVTNKWRIVRARQEEHRFERATPAQRDKLLSKSSMQSGYLKQGVEQSETPAPAGPAGEPGGDVIGNPWACASFPKICPLKTPRPGSTTAADVDAWATEHARDLLVCVERVTHMITTMPAEFRLHPELFQKIGPPFWKYLRLLRELRKTGKDKPAVARLLPGRNVAFGYGGAALSLPPAERQKLTQRLSNTQAAVREILRADNFAAVGKLYDHFMAESFRAGSLLQPAPCLSPVAFRTVFRGVVERCAARGVRAVPYRDALFGEENRPLHGVAGDVEGGARIFTSGAYQDEITDAHGIATNTDQVAVLQIETGGSFVLPKSVVASAGGASGGRAPPDFYGARASVGTQGQGHGKVGVRFESVAQLAAERIGAGSGSLPPQMPTAWLDLLRDVESVAQRVKILEDAQGVAGPEADAILLADMAAYFEKVNKVLEKVADRAGGDDEEDKTSTTPGGQLDLLMKDRGAEADKVFQLPPRLVEHLLKNDHFFLEIDRDLYTPDRLADDLIKAVDVTRASPSSCEVQVAQVLDRLAAPQRTALASELVQFGKEMRATRLGRREDDLGAYQYKEHNNSHSALCVAKHHVELLQERQSAMAERIRGSADVLYETADVNWLQHLLLRVSAPALTTAGGFPAGAGGAPPRQQGGDAAVPGTTKQEPRQPQEPKFASAGFAIPHPHYLLSRPALLRVLQDWQRKRKLTSMGASRIRRRRGRKAASSPGGGKNAPPSHSQLVHLLTGTQVLFPNLMAWTIRNDEVADFLIQKRAIFFPEGGAAGKDSGLINFRLLHKLQYGAAVISPRPNMRISAHRFISSALDAGTKLTRLQRFILQQQKRQLQLLQLSGPTSAVPDHPSQDPGIAISHATRMLSDYQSSHEAHPSHDAILRASKLYYESKQTVAERIGKTVLSIVKEDVPDLRCRNVCEEKDLVAAAGVMLHTCTDPKTVEQILQLVHSVLTLNYHINTVLFAREMARDFQVESDTDAATTKTETLKRQFGPGSSAAPAAVEEVGNGRYVWDNTAAARGFEQLKAEYFERMRYMLEMMLHKGIAPGNVVTLKQSSMTKYNNHAQCFTRKAKGPSSGDDGEERGSKGRGGREAADRWEREMNRAARKQESHSPEEVGGKKVADAHAAGNSAEEAQSLSTMMWNFLAGRGGGARKNKKDDRVQAEYTDENLGDFCRQQQQEATANTEAWARD